MKMLIGFIVMTWYGFSLWVAGIDPFTRGADAGLFFGTVPLSFLVGYFFASAAEIDFDE